MSTDNLTQLKALFEEACQTTPPSCVLAYLFNGRSINKTKISLYKASKLIERGRVNVHADQLHLHDNPLLKVQDD